MPTEPALEELADMLGVLGHVDRMRLLLELRRYGPSDVASLLNAWGRCDDARDCEFDLTGDGRIDAADLAELMGSLTRGK